MTTTTQKGSLWDLDDIEETEMDRWHREQAEQGQARREAFRAKTGHYPTPVVDLATYREDGSDDDPSLADDNN